MLRKTLLLLVLFTAGRTLISCCKGGYPFRFTEVKLQNIQLGPNSFVSIVGDSSRVADYGLRLNFEHEQLATLNLPQAGIGEAAAWSCQKYYENRDTVQSVNLFTVNPFDAAHPAGSSLNDLPIVQTWLTSDILRYPFRVLTDPALVHDLNGWSGDGSPNANLLFHFNRTAPFPGVHRFRTVVTLASGRVLESTVGVRLY